MGKLKFITRKTALYSNYSSILPSQERDAPDISLKYLLKTNNKERKKERKKKVRSHLQRLPLGQIGRGVAGFIFAVFVPLVNGGVTVWKKTGRRERVSDAPDKAC